MLRPLATALPSSDPIFQLQSSPPALISVLFFNGYTPRFLGDQLSQPSHLPHLPQLAEDRHSTCFDFIRPTIPRLFDASLFANMDTYEFEEPDTMVGRLTPFCRTPTFKTFPCLVAKPLRASKSPTSCAWLSTWTYSTSPARLAIQAHTLQRQAFLAHRQHPVHRRQLSRRQDPFTPSRLLSRANCCTHDLGFRS